MNDYAIDFVVTWVDGSDPLWQQEKMKYLPPRNADASARRYRDFDLLRYWFRGVEKFAPWAGKIHFITWGHLPPWLNACNKKLHIVKHTDYLPSAALPCFNSNAIELSMHKIEGLAERFVYFNDDMFLIRPVRKQDFFRNGLPVDDAVVCPVIPDRNDDGIGRTVLNNMYLVNRHFDKKTVMSEQRGKFLTPRYGVKLLRTVCLLPWRHFPGFYNDHLPIAYCKDTFEQVWAQEQDALQQTTLRRFRDCSQDVSHWTMRYWQFCTGRFAPGSPRRGTDLDIESEDTIRFIRKQKRKMICINDKIQSQERFEIVKKNLQEAFESILPEPSSFETDNASDDRVRC